MSVCTYFFGSDLLFRMCPRRAILGCTAFSPQCSHRLLLIVVCCTTWPSPEPSFSCARVLCMLFGWEFVCLFVSCPVAFFAQVGEVKKLAPGSLSDILKEVATDADKFTIQFPQDLKVSLALATHQSHAVVEGRC